MMLSVVCLSDVCLTSVVYIWSADGVCGRPAGWRVLADRARGSTGLAQGSQGCCCALQTWAGAYRGDRPPTACSVWFLSRRYI